MYAVIKTGGKQYKVVPGEKLKVEQLPAEVGAQVVLDQVLLIGELKQDVNWGALIDESFLPKDLQGKMH